MQVTQAVRQQFEMELVKRVIDRLPIKSQDKQMILSKLEAVKDALPQRQ